MYWDKLPFKKVKETVFEALGKNINYIDESILGLPATYLDQEQFYFEAPFLKEAAFLSTFISNPNHIGCHTYSKGESYFSGTQALEVDLLRICAEEIFGAGKASYDGYVAPGGTEANIQAQWIYRNYFMKEHGAKLDEIGLVFSKDVHYSAYKGCNLLSISPITVEITEERLWDLNDLKNQLINARVNGIKYLIVHLTMGTTMYGSVDVPTPIMDLIKQYFLHYFVHVDAAFGGFIYPFTNPNCQLTFANPDISSVTIDGHKMLQAPYGTGIFLCRKGLMEYAQTVEASYVQGTDFTLCGSRSGANAISMWMILMTYGSEGWKYQMQRLIDRTDRICEVLDEIQVPYFRNEFMNIVAMDANFISDEIAKKYHLVADDFSNPKWWKIVTMAHVEKPIIDKFLIDLQQQAIQV
ncbi:MAG: pyridoxal-dependent decarboxylase [Crocinitomicaceae bacterium]